MEILKGWWCVFTITLNKVFCVERISFEFFCLVLLSKIASSTFEWVHLFQHEVIFPGWDLSLLNYPGGENCEGLVRVTWGRLY